jgi:hypothetical protein
MVYTKRRGYDLFDWGVILVEDDTWFGGKWGIGRVSELTVTRCAPANKNGVIV